MTEDTRPRIRGSQHHYEVHVALVIPNQVPKKANYAPGVKLSLRMVPQYIQLNAATIKFNYPMKRMESIVNTFEEKEWDQLMRLSIQN